MGEQGFEEGQMRRWGFLRNMRWECVGVDGEVAAQRSPRIGAGGEVNLFRTVTSGGQCHISIRRGSVW